MSIGVFIKFGITVTLFLAEFLKKRIIPNPAPPVTIPIPTTQPIGVTAAAPIPSDAKMPVGAKNVDATIVDFATVAPAAAIPVTSHNSDAAFFTFRDLYASSPISSFALNFKGSLMMVSMLRNQFFLSVSIGSYLAPRGENRALIPAIFLASSLSLRSSYRPTTIPQAIRIGVTIGPRIRPSNGIADTRKPAIAPKIAPKVTVGYSLKTRQIKSMIFRPIFTTYSPTLIVAFEKVYNNSFASAEMSSRSIWLLMASSDITKSLIDLKKSLLRSSTSISTSSPVFGFTPTTFIFMPPFTMFIKPPIICGQEFHWYQ